MGNKYEIKYTSDLYFSLSALVDLGRRFLSYTLVVTEVDECGHFQPRYLKSDNPQHFLWGENIHDNNYLNITPKPLSLV